MYEELRGLIRHGVASSIFRVTIQRQPPDGGLARSLADGAAALRAGSAGRSRGRWRRTQIAIRSSKLPSSTLAALEQSGDALAHADTQACQTDARVVRIFHRV